MHDHTLKQSAQADYLGVTLQNDLKWNTHIQTIVNKSNKTLGMLRRHLWKDPPKTKELAYQALVRSRLDYCAPVWDPHTQNLIYSLEMVQRRAARYILGIYDPYASVSEMIKQLKWCTLAQRREQQRLLLFYKTVNNLVAVEKSKYLSQYSGRSRHFNSQSFHKPPSTCDVHKFSFFPRTIPTWNALPDLIVSAPSVEAFRQSLLNHTSV